VESDLQSTEEQVPEASADAQASASEASASQPQAESPAVVAQMNAAIRGELLKVVSASKSDTDEGTDDAEGSDGESTPSGDVKPSDARQPGRRGAAAEIERLKAENARYKADLEAANPPPPDASEEARKAIIATEQRYRDLNHRPDTDPIFYEGDNWAWLQEQKAKRAVAPELRQHYDTVLEADRAALRAETESFQHRVLNTIAGQIVTLAALPGVDGEALKRESSFEMQGRMLYDAGRATAAEETKRLRDELAEAKRELYGSLPRTLNGGRSAPGRSVNPDAYMNDVIRNGGFSSRR